VIHELDLREDLKISGEGLPRFGSFGRGNLIIRLKVKTPKKISAKAKKILGEIEKELESATKLPDYLLMMT
jgi:DnaJ-class molecular chaperone